MQRTTIFEHEKGLRFRKGMFEGVIGPGTHFLFGKVKVLKMDMREREFALGGQEVMTVDGATFRLSMSVSFAINDLYRYYQSFATDSYGNTLVHVFAQSFLHTQIQVAIREWITPLSMDEALEKRGELAEITLKACQAAAEAVGVSVTAVKLIEFNLTGALKSARADILKAEMEGRAAMQRARNESATLRSLVNSARLTREHPGLLELRILASGQKPRVTFIVGQPSENGLPAANVDTEES